MGIRFQIQEFRRPEFEVTARNETSGPYFAGGEALLSVAAKYYAGGPLPDADVTWEVKTTPANYDPPNWPDFVFGEWQPWWNIQPMDFPGPDGNTQTETFTGKTDATGTHYLRLDFNQLGKPEQNPRPMSIICAGDRDGCEPPGLDQQHFPARPSCRPVYRLAQPALFCRTWHSPQSGLHRHRPGWQPARRSARP